MGRNEINSDRQWRPQLAIVACCVQMVVAAMPVRAAEPVRVINGDAAVAVGTAPATTSARASVPPYPSAPDGEWPGPAAIAGDAPAKAAAPPVEITQAGPSIPAWTSPASPADSGRATGPRLQAEPSTVAGSAPVVTRLTRYNRRSVAGRGEPEGGSLLRVAARSDSAFNIVECLAGCLPDRRTVYYAPRDLASAVRPQGKVAPALTRVADASVITCVAGCYSTPKSYAASPVRARQQQAQARPDGPVATVAGGVDLAAATATVGGPTTRMTRLKRIKSLTHFVRARQVATRRGAAKVIRVAAPL